MRRRKIWRLVAVTALLAVMTISTGLTILNNGSLPASLTNLLIAQIEEQLPVNMHISEASFASPFSLVLNGVEVEPRFENVGPMKITGPVRVRQIRLHLNPLALVTGKWADSLRRVELVGPVATLAYQPEAVQDVTGAASESTTRSSAPIRQTSPQSQAALQISVRDGSVLLTQTGRHVLWEDVTLQGEVSATRLQLQQFNAGRAKSRLSASGSANSAQIDMDIKATDLDLPADLPMLSAWGISGAADFRGKVTGPLAQPQLVGKAVMRGGTLWDTAIDSAQGQIAFSSKGLRFSEVVIRHKDAIYNLKGEVDGLDTPIAGLDIALHSTHGRAEELLAVLDLSWPIKGEINGSMRFRGPVGEVAVEGDITARQAVLYDESVDTLQGRFSWANNVLTLNGAEAALGDGRLAADGQIALDGSKLGLDVEVTDWPLEQVTHMPPALAGIQGRAALNGHLAGSAAEPVFEGQILGRNIQKDNLAITRVNGPVTLAKGTISTTGMSARTSGGGSWWLQGEIGRLLQDPVLAVTMRVEGESLSALLRMGGYKLPALLVDGVVNGDVETSGSFANASTRLNLHLAGAENADDVLQLEILISERQVKLLHLG